MSFNFYGDITDQTRKLKTFQKTQHSLYDYHIPYNPFKIQNATLDPTNIKQGKRFNWNQGAMEEQVDYLKNPYQKEPTIPYFQAKIPAFVENRENRGSTISYKNMVHNLGWN